MTLRKTSIALGSAVLALAAASLTDTASAANPRFGGGSIYYPGGGFLYRAPQPNQSSLGASSRPPSSDMRGSQQMGRRIKDNQPKRWGPRRVP